MQRLRMGRRLFLIKVFFFFLSCGILVLRRGIEPRAHGSESDPNPWTDRQGIPISVES